MYISDKDALKYGSGLLLILLPFLASVLNYWSWIVEILLLLAVFYYSRMSSLRLTISFLAIGYLVSFLILRTDGFWQIGYTPWAGILLVALKDRGLDTAASVFWSLMLAAALNALPLLPNLGQALTPENLNETVNSALEFYRQQGSLSVLEEQGISSQEIERYFRLALPVYFKLLPGASGVMAMLSLGLSYLIFRLSLRKVYGLKAFSHWRFPWYTIWVAIAGIGAYLGGDYLKNEMLTIFGMNLMLVIAVVCLLIGISCLVYWVKHPKTPRFLVVALVIAALLFSHFLLASLIFVGLFDLVLNFRHIPEKIEEGQS
ncbi:MAG: DUF2232 domain-containing protein [Peptococcaceae bacterium]|nr:DUF2232 domain-containing protein [Peptococcaceae bacterium]